jgi:hypothetical protein
VIFADTNGYIQLIAFINQVSNSRTGKCGFMKIKDQIHMLRFTHDIAIPNGYRRNFGHLKVVFVGEKTGFELQTKSGLLK